MATSCLPHLFFLPLVLIINLASLHAKCLKDQQTLLLELKSELIFNSSISQKLVLWNQTSDCCSWDGVECDDAGHVISLLLDDEAISGGFQESSSLFGLRYLKSLNLANNQFNNTQIPRGIHRLKYLEFLRLSNASFVGTIPPTLGNLTELVYLDLSYNFLTGSLSYLHFEALSNLTDLVLEFNSLIGSIPHSVFALPSLRSLYLSHNQFSGEINESPVMNMSNMFNLDLSENSFTGSISFIMCGLPSLQRLILSNNQFSGKINELPCVNISNVGFLNLSHNAFQGSFPLFLFALPSLNSLLLSNNRFSGKINEFPIVNMSSLEDLDLSFNSLSGRIPQSLLHLPSLGSLRLSNNQFSEFPIVNISTTAKSDLWENIPDFIKNSPVESVDLSNNRIVGEIPSWIWEIGNRMTLYQLNLSCNLLVDLQKPYRIPDSLWLLDLHSNMLRGDLPIPQSTSYEGFFDSTYVDFSDNKFDTIPPDFGNFPGRYISLANNSLSGAIPISLCNAVNLLVLDLSFNNLSDAIPPCLVQNISELGVLNLKSNNISGDIPDTFPVNCSLQTLNLADNNLGGRIPNSLELCKQLEVMNVGGNNIDDSFPCMLSQSLRVLVLRSNRFWGEITCYYKRWPNLQIIDIAFNNFSGSLHPVNFSSWRGMIQESDAGLKQNHLGYAQSQYLRGYYLDEVTLIIKGVELILAKIRVDFTAIDFSCNNFHGEIPTAIGDLRSLYLLNLSHNSLTGTIPKSCGNLMQLGSLDLLRNQLRGTIPEELAHLTFLSVLNLSYNKLVGVIPSGRQFQTFAADSFQGNAGLCGFPLNISCKTSDDNNDLSPPEGEDGRGIEWEYISAAVGYVVGLGSVVWLLLLCRSFREKYFGKIDEVAEQMFGGRSRRRRRQARRRVVRNQGRRQ